MFIFVEGFEVTRLPDGFHYVPVVRVGGADNGNGVPVETTQADVDRNIIEHNGRQWYRTLDRNMHAYLERD